MQSPIDLPKTAAHGPEGLALTYYADDLRIVDNGHTIQVNHGKLSTLEIDERSFRLIQYHFHSPSEHTVEGLRSPLELHYRANVRPLQPRPNWCLDTASHAKHEQQNALGDDKE